MRIRGRISPAKAASILGVHINTVYAWCQKAVNGEPSKLYDVKQHVSGYYWISLEEVQELKNRNHLDEYR